jgi:hypothetical protein
MAGIDFDQLPKGGDRPAQDEVRRIAANIAKLPELLRGTVRRQAEEGWGR